MDIACNLCNQSFETHGSDENAPCPVDPGMWLIYRFRRSGDVYKLEGFNTMTSEPFYWSVPYKFGGIMRRPYVFALRQV